MNGGLEEEIEGFNDEYDDDEYGLRSGEMCGIPEIDAETGKAREYKCAEDDCGKIFTD